MFQIDIDQLLKTLYVANEDDVVTFNEADKKSLLKNLSELKMEMSTDTKQLSEQNTIKTLLVTKAILDKKLTQIQGDNRNLEGSLKEKRSNLNKMCDEVDTFKDEIRQLEAIEIKDPEKK